MLQSCLESKLKQKHYTNTNQHKWAYGSCRLVGSGQRISSTSKATSSLAELWWKYPLLCQIHPWIDLNSMVIIYELYLRQKTVHTAIFSRDSAFFNLGVIIQFTHISLKASCKVCKVSADSSSDFLHFGWKQVNSPAVFFTVLKPDCCVYNQPIMFFLTWCVCFTSWLKGGLIY